MNVGIVDRNIRLILAGFFLASGTYTEGSLRMACWTVAAVLAATALFRFCPAWWIFRMNTTQERLGPIHH